VTDLKPKIQEIPVLDTSVESITTDICDTMIEPKAGKAIRLKKNLPMK